MAIRLKVLSIDSIELAKSSSGALVYTGTVKIKISSTDQMGFDKLEIDVPFGPSGTLGDAIKLALNQLVQYVDELGAEAKSALRDYP